MDFGPGHVTVWEMDISRVDIDMAQRDAASTDLSYRADMFLEGRIARLGARVTTGTTEKLIARFFDDLATEIETALESIDG